MKKKMSVLLIILCITQLLSSCGETRGMSYGYYDFQTEVIYQKEGYVPSYAYQFYRTLGHRMGISFMGTELMISESSLNIMKEDRSFEKPVMETEENVKATKVKKILKQFSKEIVKDIEAHDTKFEVLEYEDVTYVLAYYLTDTEEYQYYLFKYSTEEDKAYTKFLIDLSLASNKLVLAELVVCADNTICVRDEIWFDENLETIERTSISYKGNEEAREELKASFLSTGDSTLVELATNMDYPAWSGWMGEVYYCVFTLVSQEPQVDVRLTEFIQDVYLAEMNLDGEVLSVVKIDKMVYGCVDNVVPKELGSDGEYYDVKKQVAMRSFILH